MRNKYWAGLVLVLAGATSNALPLEINLVTELRQSDIYDCGGSAFPIGTFCWTNGNVAPGKNWIGQLITPVSMNPGDTLRISLTFANGQRLRWATDGISAPGYGDESLQVTPYAIPDCCAGLTNSSKTNLLSFTDPTGDLLVNNLAWTDPGVSMWSSNSGITNFTDSYFDFSGLVAEFGPYDGGGTYTFDRVAVFLFSGNFSIQPVPIPAAVWLLGSALGVLGVMRRCISS